MRDEDMVSGSRQFTIFLWIFTNVFGIVYSQQYVIPPMSFSSTPKAGSAEVPHNTKVLVCQANGIPAPVYRWLKDGQPITLANTSDTSLKIADIKRSDAGRYQCLAANAHGAILSDKAFVRVAYMVPFSTSDQTQLVRVNQGRASSITLPGLDSYPRATIQWYYGQLPIISEQQRNHVTLTDQLVLLETRLSENNKVFRATATNSYAGPSSRSQKFVLSVQNEGSLVDDIGPEIIIPPTDTIAVQGSDSAATLECVANARSLDYLTISWYRVTTTGRTLIRSNNLRYLITQHSRRLSIKAPTISDSGRYECEATFNRPGGTSFPAVSAAANITVHVKPNFQTYPQTQIQQDVGGTALMNCQAVGIPAVNIRWYRNAAPISSMPANRYSVLESGSLRISDLLNSDSGVFQCFASNTAGEVSASTWLRVQSSPPSISKKPENVSVIAGQSARFQCEVSGAPKPTVTWLRVTNSSSGEEIILGSNSHFQILQKELLIPVTDVTDSGRYICRASNSKGTKQAEAFLRAAVRTQLTNPPVDRSAILGSTLTLNCGFQHDANIAVSVYWYFDDVLIPLDDLRKQTKQDGRLVIKTGRNDMGVYRCQLISSGGNATASARLTILELPYPPTILSVTLDTVSKRNVEIKWKPGFNGNSPIKSFVVQYRIIYSGVNLGDNEAWIVANGSISANQVSYTVRNLYPAKTYQLRVAAKNDVGEGVPSLPSALVELPQQPPSGAPRRVVASPRSSTSVLLQWTAPDESTWNGDLQGYILRYKPAGYPDSTLSSTRVDNYQTKLYELRDLIVFQEYEIAVAAFNAKGMGVLSDFIRVMTLEGIPAEPPQEVTAVAINSTCIKVTWQPPNPMTINGINQGYKLKAFLVNTTEPDTDLTIPSDPFNLQGNQVGYLAGLAKYTQYEITVLCFTAKGDGPSSTPIVVRTQDDLPDEVASLMFIDILDTSLTVVWTPPASANGLLLGYTLTYMKQNQTSTKVTQNLGPNVLNYTITGLTATTAYSITVFARTRVGAGPPRTNNIESGVQPVEPESPTKVAVTNIKPRSVLLQFLPGFSGHTSITKWLVEAQIGQNVQWSLIYVESNPSAHALRVTGLKPYTDYRLRITAENIAGRSSPSEPSNRFQTWQAAPSNPPSDVSARAVNETALRILWTTLSSQDWNGESRGYKIMYRQQNIYTEYNSTIISDSNANSYIIGGLEEWTEYVVIMRSYNKVGESPGGTEVKARTRESVPSSGPSSVQASARSSTSIRVTWTAVPLRHQNGNILGYKVIYQSTEEAISQQTKNINSSATYETVLTNLRKFVQYEIQVLAYTRLGDGALSQPAATVRTFEDVPGPPSRIYFPDVTHSTAKVVWEPPVEPNGLITGYKVAYREKAVPPNDPNVIIDNRIDSGKRDYSVLNLQRQRYYVFSLTARTQLGWGQTADVEVRTEVNRKAPGSPSRPTFTANSVGSRWVTLTWSKPNIDGFSPIRNYTIQMMRVGDEWQTLVDVIQASSRSYTAENLKPNMRYMFRIAAHNDIGASPYSPQSEIVHTQEAAPDSPPSDVKVIPRTKTSVQVTWKPPALDTWNGIPIGYKVHYRKTQDQEDNTSKKYKVVAYTSTSTQLLGLTEKQYYEIRIQGYNKLGSGPYSEAVEVYVGEAVPTGPPQSLTATAQSAKSIFVSWLPPPVETQNGELLGYKIHYWVDGTSFATARMKVITATDTRAQLTDLLMYTRYHVQVAAFNPAGDGPNVTVQCWTLEGVPGPPGKMEFTVTTLTSVNVSWAEPERPNGVIQVYEVSYYPDRSTDGITRSVQAKINGSKTYYIAKELEEAVQYVFMVTARTNIGQGPPRYGNISTGPQPGSPEAPGLPSYKTSDTAVTLSWKNAFPGAAPITGYIIQALERGESKWMTVIHTNDPETTAIVSFLNLKLNREYQFRVIAINSRGISSPSQATQFVRTPDFEQGPFYHKWWFLVIVALTGFIFIILVVSLLCITGRQKKRRYKENGAIKTIVTVEDSAAIRAEEEGGFSTFDMRQSQRKSQRNVVRSAVPSYIRSPPRPSPASVTYSDEDSKATPDGDSQSTNSMEKASLSSTSSQVYDSESEPESEKGEAASAQAFVNHYVNDPIRQSWKRTKGPVGSAAAYSYPDSETDSAYQHTVNNMNGGHIIMNNMAGSRAPLPGFSSFV